MSQTDGKQVTITIASDNYEINSEGVSIFELLGTLEQIVFDLKTAQAVKADEPIMLDSAATGNESSVEQAVVPDHVSTVPGVAVMQKSIEENDQLLAAPPARLQATVDRLKKSSATQPTATPAADDSSVPQPATDIRLRIGNAVKAIKNLGGQTGQIDLSKMSDEELQTELEELTTQYKRLKNSKGK